MNTKKHKYIISYEVDCRFIEDFVIEADDENEALELSHDMLRQLAVEIFMGCTHIYHCEPVDDDEDLSTTRSPLTGFDTV